MIRFLRRNVYCEVALSFTLVLLFTSVFFNADSWIIETLPSTLKPSFFPTSIAGIMLVASLIFLGQTFVALRHLLRGEVDEERIMLQMAREESGSSYALLAYLFLLFMYLLGFYYIGFLYSTPIIMFFVSLMLGLERKVLGAVSYVLFAYIVDYATFEFMQIILPTGVLFE